MNNTINIVSIIEQDPKKGLELVFSKYAQKLYAYCITNWGFSEDEAWSLIYKTLETLIDSVNSYDFDNEKHLENFLYKVYRNNLKQLYRKQKTLEKHIKFIPLEESMNNQVGQDVNVAEAFFEAMINDFHIDEQNPNLKLLEKALDSLSDSDRELLLLRGQNFTYKQITKLLKTNENQLKVKFFRAKKRLLKKIEELKKEMV